MFSIGRFSSSLVPKFSSALPLNPQFHGSIILWFPCSLVLRFHASLVPWFCSSTALLFPFSL
ncbi:hypothetical protein GBAR_LOCUS10375, partial [Geodia barretti]